MALPGDVTTFTLTFGHSANGYTDATGVVALPGTKAKLFPVDLVTGKRINVVHVASGQVIVPIPVIVTIDSEGKATVGPLAHTDNPTLSPIGFGYHVEWQVASGPRRAAPVDKTFAVPAAAGATVDYDLLDAAEAVPGVLVPLITGAAGPPGDPGTGVLVDGVAVETLNVNSAPVTATDIPFTPISTVSATNVQAAIAALTTRIIALEGGVVLTYALLTESGDTLTTESGDVLVTQ